MPAYAYLDTAILGLRLGIESLSNFIETFRAADLITTPMPYGSAIFMTPGDPVNGYLAHQDTCVLVMSGAFTSGDTTVTPTLNGTALTAVTWVAYGSDTLMSGKICAEIIAALVATSPGVTATYNTGSHTFTVTAPGVDVVLSLVCSNNTTTSTTYSSSAIFMGVSTFDQVSYKLTTGGYPRDTSGNYAYLGQIWVYASVAVNSGQLAYIIIAPGATQGQFTNVAGTNNYTCRAIFRSDTTGAGLVLIELRGKQNFAGTL